MGFITLEEAKAINEDITQDEIDSLEVAIRELTNNRFYRELNGLPAVRYNVERIKDGNLILGNTVPAGLRVGSRIELSGTRYNDSLLTVKEASKGLIKIDEADDLLDEDTVGLFVTLVHYPADVRSGALDVLSYKDEIGGDRNVKSITVSRVRKTYYDLERGSSVEGVPAFLFDFIDKYQKLEWGG